MARIDKSDVEKGCVPSFFVERWMKLHGDRNPMTEYARECGRDKILVVLGVLGCVLIVISTFLVGFAIVCLVFKGDLPVLPLIGGLTGSLLAVALLRLGPEIFSSDEGEGHDFLSSLDELFEAFDIDPSPETGKLTYEEFRGYVEDALRKKSADVERATGFDKFRERNGFNLMHRVALERSLCHESHAKYYPVVT